MNCGTNFCFTFCTRKIYISKIVDTYIFIYTKPNFNWTFLRFYLLDKENVYYIE